MKLSTSRLELRRPLMSDAQEMFGAYAGNEEETKYLSWNRHESVDDTRAFIEFSDREWATSQVGPLLLESKESGQIIGTTGLGFETPQRASTGYVLAQSSWGVGFASEALSAMVTLAKDLNAWRLEAICHHTHERSARVLEKQGFKCEGTLRRYSMFPNLNPNEPQDVLMYACVLHNTSES